MYKVLMFWALGFLAGATALAQKHIKQKVSPNILLIVADDLGWADVGYQGSTFYTTPHIDSLARMGMVFTQAYSASPICSPARAALLTGKHPVRTDITDYIPGNQYYGPHAHQKLASQPFAQQLSLQETTLAEALKAAGYRTFFAGKWHLGEKEMYYPHQQGFDINKGGNGTGHPAGGYFSPYQNPQLPDGPQGEYLTDRLTDETILFMQQKHPGPFFACLSYYTVHLPLEGKPEKVKKYQDLLQNGNLAPEVFGKNGSTYTKLVQNVPTYAAMVESLDENIGRLMDFLDKAGLLENTVVVFTSDNGGMASNTTTHNIPTTNLPLRAGKGHLYEGGIRVPLIFSWPGHILQGQTIHSPAVGTDIYPTLLALAGLPLLPQQHTEGLSLLPVLQGARLAPRPIYWHFPHYSGGLGGRPAAAVRLGKYKLLQWYEDKHIELYNLEKDMGEKVNLAFKKRVKTRQLRKMLHTWLQDTQAKIPFANPHYTAE